jgi:hypothetical protein
MCQKWPWRARTERHYQKVAKQLSWAPPGPDLWRGRNFMPARLGPI